MKAVIPLFFVLFPFSAIGGDPGYAGVACKPEGNQLELDACAANDEAAADKELNAVYRQILVEYKDEPLFLEKLKAAEELWIKLRDAEVEARFPIADGENPLHAWGSSYPMSFAYYRAELTRERTKHLRIWLDGIEEGDLSAGSVHWKKN